MDIVTLSSRGQKKRLHRDTTEIVSKDEVYPNVSQMSTHGESTFSEEGNDHNDLVYSGLTECELSASCHRVEHGVVEIESAHYEGSQMDVLKELGSRPSEMETHKRSYQHSYERALDNMLTPFIPPANLPQEEVLTSCVDHVLMELLSTEETYVGDLVDIIEGYITPLESRIGGLQINESDIGSLFGNMREIKHFNWSVLLSLKSCSGSYKRVGQCFLEKADGFKSHYSHYCNNYPTSVQVLIRHQQQDSPLSQFLKICQRRLNHMLPLGAYLLKPVQRIMKYSLLLEQVMKNMSVDDDGFAEVSYAVDKMTSVSKHVNEMKEKYDADIHIRSLQNLIRGMEGIVDLTTAGCLVLEESLRYGGRSTVPSLRSRADRYVYIFLFKKLMLMTKRDDDGYQYKAHLKIKDIQLTERIQRETNGFQVRQVSTGNYYTLQAPTYKRKEKWVNTIKTLLVESIPGLPDRAKMLIMAGFPPDFGDSAGRSPRSPHRQRHFSDKLSPVSSDKRDGPRQAQNSSDVVHQSRAIPRTRSNTTLGLITGQLVKASLVASLQLEPFKTFSGEQKAGKDETFTYAKPVESLPEVQNSSPEVIIKEKGRKPMFVNVKVQADPLLYVPGSFQNNENYEEIYQPDLIGPVETSCTFFDSDTAENSSPAVNEANLNHQNEAGSVSSVITEDSTNPFFGPSTDYDKSLSLSSGFNEGDRQTLQSLLYFSQDSLSETDAKSVETPSLAPPLEFADCCSVSAAISESMHAQSNNLPDRTKIVHNIKAQSKSERGSTKNPRTVLRRQSYTLKKQQRVVHGSQRSMSSENSPINSPTSDKSYKEGRKQNQCSLSNKGLISVVAPNEHRLENPCVKIIESSMMPLLPGKQVNGAISEQSTLLQKLKITDRESPRMNKQEEEVNMATVGKGENKPVRFISNENRELLHVQRRPTSNETVPLCGNPEEEMSFNEVLQYYDTYASSTGETARSSVKKQSRSPSVTNRKKRKKDRNRRMTVSGIDKATILAAEEGMCHTSSTTPEPSRKTFSKVHHLAREYSRRMRDHQNSNRFKRSPTVSEEIKTLGKHGQFLGLQKTSFEGIEGRKDTAVKCLKSDGVKDIGDPLRSMSLARLHPEQTPMAQIEQVSRKPLGITRSHSAEFEWEQGATPIVNEMQTNRGFKGLVKSLVVKFGGGK